FCCGCCRKVWNCLTDRRSQIAVEKGEEWADSSTFVDLWPFYCQARDYFNAHYTHRNGQAYGAAAEGCQYGYANGPLRVYLNLRRDHVCPVATPLPDDFFCQVLHCLFGNPFWRVTLEPDWWTSNSLGLAQGFSTSEPSTACRSWLTRW